MNSEALKNLVIINGKDIWTEFGAFLTEEKKGGRENLTSIMSPSKVKTHVAVNIRVSIHAPAWGATRES